MTSITGIVQQPAANVQPEETVTAQPGFENLALLLKRVKLSTISWRTAKGKLIRLSLDDSVDTAMKLLCANNILSAPVFGVDGVFCGITDMLQITRFVTRLVSGAIPTDLKISDQDRIKTTTIRDLTSGRASRGQRIAGEYHEPILESATLEEAHNIMVRYGLHHLAIREEKENNEVIGMLSQSVLIDFLYTHVGTLGEKTRQIKVRDMRPYQILATINENKIALRGFELMDEISVSRNGIAVVNDTGTLVDVLSTSDLRGICPPDGFFYSLFKTVKDFKQDVRKRYSVNAEDRWVQTVLATDSLETVLRLMSTTKSHRVFVVDYLKVNTPLDIITQTDLLRFIHQTIH